MNMKFLKAPGKAYSLVVFLPEEDVAKNKKELESYGEMENVHMVVQPCPYEGVEFLYRMDLDFSLQHISVDKEIFWHAIEISPDMTKSEVEVFSGKHYSFFLAILNQEVSNVSKYKKEIESFLQS